MNIFYIDKDPRVAAKAMTNKHVVKMILESAQLLSTAHRLLDGYEAIIKSKSGSNLKKWKHFDLTYDNLLYKSTHVNHPSAIWVRESAENYQWLYKHFVALGNEYKERYNNTHKSISDLAFILAQPPKNISYKKMTPIKVAITNKKWHRPDPVESYRLYYKEEKLHTSEDWQRYQQIIGI